MQKPGPGVLIEELGLRIIRTTQDNSFSCAGRKLEKEKSEVTPAIRLEICCQLKRGDMPVPFTSTKRGWDLELLG